MDEFYVVCFKMDINKEVKLSFVCDGEFFRLCGIIIFWYCVVGLFVIIFFCLFYYDYLVKGKRV